jgi:hypothetical protein
MIPINTQGRRKKMARANQRNQGQRKNFTIADHYIKDLQTFDQVTGDPRQVAGLYFYMLLDCLVELAYKVSKDFFKRPHLYTQLAGTAGVLASLHARYGSDEEVPSKEQRDAMYVPLFGEIAGSLTNDNGDFPRLRDQLVSAAAAFSERVYDTGEDMLRARVRTTHRPFKEFLTGLHGDSLVWSKDGALSPLTKNRVYNIFRNQGVASVFGISTVPKEDWPYDQDSNADKLVEEVFKQIVWVGQSEGALMTYLTREHFSNLQRAALRGADAIATIIDYDEGKTEDDLDRLITKCYTWGSALVSLSVTPVAAEAGSRNMNRTMLRAGY